MTTAVFVLLAPKETCLTIKCDNKTTSQYLKSYQWKENKDIAGLIIGTCKDRNINLKIEWVKGYAGNPLNERSDEDAKLGASSNLRADIYHRSRKYMEGYYWANGYSNEIHLGKALGKLESEQWKSEREGYDICKRIK